MFYITCVQECREMQSFISVAITVTHKGIILWMAVLITVQLSLTKTNLTVENLYAEWAIKKVLKWFVNHWCKMMTAWLIGPISFEVSIHNDSSKAAGHCVKHCSWCFLSAASFTFPTAWADPYLFNLQKSKHHRAIKVSTKTFSFWVQCKSLCIQDA